MFMKPKKERIPENWEENSCEKCGKAVKWEKRNSHENFEKKANSHERIFLDRRWSVASQISVWNVKLEIRSFQLGWKKKKKKFGKVKIFVEFISFVRWSWWRSLWIWYLEKWKKVKSLNQIPTKFEPNWILKVFKAYKNRKKSGKKKLGSRFL